MSLLYYLAFSGGGTTSVTTTGLETPIIPIGNLYFNSFDPFNTGYNLDKVGNEFQFSFHGSSELTLDALAILSKSKLSNGINGAVELDPVLGWTKFGLSDQIERNPVSPYYYYIPYLAEISTTGWRVYNGVSIDASGSAAITNGKVEVSGGTVKLYYSTDNKSTWTLAYTWATAVSADLYPALYATMDTAQKEVITSKASNLTLTGLTAFDLGTLPAPDADIDLPQFTKVIPVDGAIYFKLHTVTGQTGTKVQISTDVYFETGVTEVTVTDNEGTITAINGTAYYVRGLAQGVSGLRKTAAFMFPGSVEDSNNKCTPHVVNLTKLHPPKLAEIYPLYTSCKIHLISQDIRDVDFTVEISTDKTFATTDHTQTIANCEIEFTGLTINIPYFIRFRSNAEGLTSSDWVQYSEYIIVGTQLPLTLGGDGDSNTAGVNNAASFVYLSKELLNEMLFNYTLSRGVSSTWVAEYPSYDIYNRIDNPSQWQYPYYDVTRPNYSTVMFGTNDFTIGSQTISDVITSMLFFASYRRLIGYKHIFIAPGIPYGGGSFPDGIPYFEKWNSWLKAEWRTSLKGFGFFSLFDTDEFHISTHNSGASEANNDWYGDNLHYTNRGQSKIAAFVANKVNAIAGARNIVIPASPSISFNSGTRNMTVTLPTGFSASDAEYTIDWDGRVGMASEWTTLSSLTVNLPSSQAAGTVAVRIKNTHGAAPSAPTINPSTW